jgi:hypothetical protein
MRKEATMSNSLLLKGLDGSNPLAFLAALGTALTSHRFCPETRLSWQSGAGGWRPVLTGFDGSDDEFAVALYETLAAAEASPFDIEKKLPFSCDAFRVALLRNQSKSIPGERRSVDLLAGFGSDAHRNKDQDFADSSLRMVRSGDSSGNGLLAYALAMRKQIVADDLRRALFSTWDYRDEDFSLRWDPVEDQRYALRWYDPSPQANKKHSLRTMRGANILALEALALFPVQPHSKGATTTGFSKHGERRERVEYFIWPIWESPVTVDVVRSLLCVPELHMLKPQRANVRQIGIVEIYRCERIAPSKYYKNFSPAQPA